MVCLILPTLSRSSRGDIVFDTLGSNRSSGPTVGGSTYQQSPDIVNSSAFQFNSSNINTSAVFTATSAGGILLQRNTKYWIYLSPLYGTSDSDYNFVQDNENIGGYSYLYYGSKENPFQISNGYDNYTAAFQVSGVIASSGALVPEPASFLLVLGGSSMNVVACLRSARVGRVADRDRINSMR